MDELKRKRTAITQQFSKICNKIESLLNTDNKEEALVRSDKFENIYNQYDEVQSQLELLDDDEANHRDTHEDRYFEIKLLINKARENFVQPETDVSNASPVPSEAASVVMHQKATLPEIKLPTFGGDIQDWLFFSDMFSGLVDSDINIPDIVKFHYLRTSLKDEALHVIQNLELSSNNYQVAWKLLKDRYDNKKLMIHTHLKSLFELAPLTSENHTQLHQFIDSINKHKRALEILKEPVNQWDTILIHLLTSKFNLSIRKEWESKVANKKPEEMPKLQELIDFLNHKCQTWELIDKGKWKSELPKQQLAKKNDKHVIMAATVNKCVKCKNSHQIYRCEEFLKLLPRERIQEAKRLRLCLNCLRTGHVMKDCRASSCQKCKNQHNTLLHNQDDETAEKTDSTEVTVISTMNSTITNSQILLPTALISVLDKKENQHPCRTLLDSGSQANFITKSLFDTLNLPKQHFNIDVSGISQSSMKVKHKAKITIKSRFTNFTTTLEFFIVNKITENLPTESMNHLECDIPPNLFLADPDFSRSKEINMLLGAEIFYDLHWNQQIRSSNSSHIFQKTKFGWVISGKFTPFTTNQDIHFNTHLCTLKPKAKLDEDLKKLWSLEECNINSNFSSPDQRKCEQTFIETTKQDLSSHFIVTLPTNNNLQDLCDSKYTLSSNSWPIPPVNLKSEESLLETKPPLMFSTTRTYTVILTRFSSFKKLTYFVAYCLRLLHNGKIKSGRIKSIPIKDIKSLTVEETDKASKGIIGIRQQEEFSTEIELLKHKRSIEKRSRLYRLGPFLNHDNLIRVRGRLKNAEISLDQKHPLVLPGNHHVSELIVREEHCRLQHCGTEQLLAIIRLKYWPIPGRRLIRKITQNCIQCFKTNPRISKHLMGNLPANRVTIPERPFLITGIDYAGPIQIKDQRRRGRSKSDPTKIYVAVFVCFATKACHFELVSDLSTKKFLDAFRRFTSRRGLPAEVYSDNGTTFVGANRQIQEFYQFLKNQDNVIASELAKQKIKWNFNPPRSPHFGGLWESTVKSMKRHFYKVTQNLKLTFEEILTLLTGIEACMNSRPLTPVSSDPNDFSFLCPSHFLIGDVLIEPLNHGYDDLQTQRTSISARWQHVQEVRRHFWQRFQREYFHQLQVRSKWASSSNNIQEGTLVLITEENLPPLKWATGRVIATHPGQDGVVRVVTIKTSSGVYKRAVRKICVLPINDTT